MPVLAKHFTHAVVVGCMVTHWLHTFGLASLVDVVGNHLTLNWYALNLSVLVLELAVLLVEVRVSFDTESVSILLIIIMGPFVTVACVQKRSVSVGPAAIEEGKLNLLYRNTVTAIMRRV
jgi:hypothetical protein